jgi:hypothetical protein
MDKLYDFKSPEKVILDEVFNNIPMMDKWIPSIIENYIYSLKIKQNSVTKNINTKYRIKYDKKDGEYEQFYRNGALAIKTTYINDEINGLYQEWDSHGKVIIYAVYTPNKK